MSMYLKNSAIDDFVFTVWPAEWDGILIHIQLQGHCRFEGKQVDGMLMEDFLRNTDNYSIFIPFFTGRRLSENVSVGLFLRKKSTWSLRKILLVTSADT